MRAGAGERHFGQAVLFSEVLSLVLENYVDPVEGDRLLQGAYEGLLAGTDANGAYLSAEEVSEWKAGSDEPAADPGLSVLKSGVTMQVVAVDRGSPAAEAGVVVGDQVRSVDGRPLGELSLAQAQRLLRGPAGSAVKLELVHPAEGYSRSTVEVTRASRAVPPFELAVERGIGVLTVRDLGRLSAEALGAELGEIRSRGVSWLLIDLRNSADLRPRGAAAAAGVFCEGNLLRLRDRSGRLIEDLPAGDGPPAWSGSLALLVNGATAGGAEALAAVLHERLGSPLLGESTYGLGAEPRLYELGEGGAGLLVSAALWETPAGKTWNGDGLSPDEEIEGRGDTFEAAAADQLRLALDRVEALQRAAVEERKAA
jgi:carboxyl-terminal processing protease